MSKTKNKPIETGYDNMLHPKTKKQSKTERLIEFLKSNKCISPKEAWTRFGIYRLGARIFELQRKGWSIKTEMTKTPLGEEHAVYIINYIPKDKQ